MHSLALVDVWGHHDDERFFRRMMKNYYDKLLPLYVKAIDAGIPVFDCTSRESLIDGIPIGPGDASKMFMVTDKIFYAGYASDMCVLFKPFGMIAARALGKEVVFVHDASISYDPDMHPYIVRLVKRNIGEIVTVDECIL